MPIEGDGLEGYKQSMENHPKLKNLIVRTLTSVVLFGILFLCCYYGSLTFLVVFGAVFFMTIREMEDMLKHLGKRVCMVPAYIFASFFGIIYYMTEKNFLVVTAFGLLMLTATVVWQVLLTREDNYADALYCLLPFAYPILPECAIVALFFALPEGVGKTCCYVAILCPEIGDAFAYFGGSLLGKHPLCPQISPKKTVEGSLSALPGAMLVGLGVYYAQPLWGGTVELGSLLLMGLLCGVIGQFGDLFASILKRAAGIKDFSDIIPGHGGLLDRLDSALLCAVAVLAFAILGLNI